MQAVFRLTPHVVEVRHCDPTTCNGLYWTLLVVWVVANLYTEGYRAFHKRFIPRVVGRALELDREPRLHLRLLAPAVAMGLLYAPRARLVVSWVFLCLLVVLVTWVRTWSVAPRAFIDAGVVLPLLWGALGLVWQYRARSREDCLPVTAAGAAATEER